MFDAVNDAGKMLQDRLKAVPPERVAQVIGDFEALIADGRKTLVELQQTLAAVRGLAEAARVHGVTIQFNEKETTT